MQDSNDAWPLDQSISAYRPVTPWPPPTGLIDAVLIMLASVALPLLALLALTYLTNPGMAFDAALFERALSSLSQAGSPLGLALVAAPQVVVLALTFWLAGWRGGGRRQVLASRPSSLGVAGTGALIGLALLLSAAFDLIVYLVFRHDVLADMRTQAPFLKSQLWPFFMLIVVVGAPLSEEFLFRGFQFSALAKGRFGFIGAALATDSLWTLLHVFNGYSLYGMVSIFMVGLLLSALLWRTGSIWVPIACHAANNFVALMVGLWLVSQG